MTALLRGDDPGFDTWDEPGERVHQQLARDLAEAVKERLGDEGSLAPADRRTRAEEFARDAVSRLRLDRHRQGLPEMDEEYEHELIIDVVDRIPGLGLGRLSRLLRHADIVNIHACGHDAVFIDLVTGGKVQVSAIALDDSELLGFMRDWGRRYSMSARQLNEEKPTLNIRLPDGSRLFATYGITERPHLFARKHHFLRPRLPDLVATGMMSQDVAAVLRQGVQGRLNIVIAGGMGVGKTTLLRALCNEIPANERIVTVETDFELGLDRFPDLHPDMVALEVRHANVEEVGEQTMADLVRMAMRMAATRIIVGESVGDEVVPMLRAMHSGARGSMDTVHANSSEEVIPTFVLLALLYGYNVASTTIEQLAAAAIDLIVFVDQDEDGRFVSSVREVTGWGDDGPMTHELFSPDDRGRAVRTEVSLSMRTRRRLGRTNLLADGSLSTVWAVPGEGGVRDR